MYLVWWQTVAVSWVSCGVQSATLLAWPGTYRHPVSFNHVIELLINLFVLLLSARREGEGGLELRALAAFVLLLAQRLCQPGSTAGEVDGGGGGRSDRR